MTINPIIPIWLMSVVCVILLICKRKGLWPYIRQVIAIALLFAINLRIMVPDGSVNYKKQEIDTYVLLVIDSTISMVAEDCDNNISRLDAAKEDCNEIIDKLDGARISVISFDNEARMLSPFTQDSQFAKSAVQSVSPINSFYAKGSSINIWHNLVLERLKLAREKNDGATAVFFFSDGEITTDEKLGSFKDMEEFIDYGAVFGYGSSQGAEMQVQEWSDGEYETIKDYDTWEDAVSKIDEGNLKSIAFDLGLEYMNRSSKSKLDSLLTGILSSASTEETDQKDVGYRDIYYVFLIPFILLLCWDYVAYKRKR